MEGVVSDSLRTAIAICSATRFPMQVWGRERTAFSNDAAKPLVSAWPDMHACLGPIIDEVLATGEPRGADNVPIPADRYLSASLAPIPGRDGYVEGVFCTYLETTEPVIRTRRHHTIRAIGLLASGGHDVGNMHAAIARVLAANPRDIPGAVLYLAEDTLLRAVEWIGIAPGAPELATEVPLDRWPLDRRAIDVTMRGMPGLVVPIRSPSGVAGALVFAASPNRPLDARYQAFFEIVADHVGTTLGAHAHVPLSGHAPRNALAPIKTILDVMRLRGPQPTDLDILEWSIAQAIQPDDVEAAPATPELHTSTLEIGELLVRATELVHRAFDARRQTLLVQQAAEPVAVDGDPERLAEVLASLLLDASRLGDPNTQIVLSAVRTGERVRLSVIDEGVALDTAITGSVFDRLAQPGHRLGLAVARRIVEAHAGRLAIEGSGRHRVFVIELPVALPPVASQPAGPGVTRVLVVDDNEPAAYTMRMGLGTLGYATEVAADGNAALDAVSAFVPDVALLDIGLPDMDGYELARRLRELYPDVQLVALTGLDQTSDRRAALAAGFAEFLLKPVDLDRVREVIERLARQRVAAIG